MSNIPTNEGNGNRAVWVEPEVTVLQISETAGAPGRGGQASNYVDCTKS